MEFLQPFLFWVIAGLIAACAIATVVTHNIVRAATWLLFTLAGTSGLFFLIGADLVGAVQLLVYVGGTMVLVVFGVMLTAEGPFITMRTSSAEWAISAATGLAFLAVLVLSFLLSKPERNPKLADEAVYVFAPKTTLSDPTQSDNAKTSSYTMVIGQGFAGVGVGPAHKDPAFPSRPQITPKAEPKQSKEPPLNDEAKKAEIDDLDTNLKNLGKKPAEKVEPKIPAAADADAPNVVPASAGIVRMNYLLPFEIVSVHLLVVLIAAAYLARAKRWEARSK
ncbi:MAG: NADH-quinone oxidoreductase subunit J [Planctomycetota bacterium]